MHNTTYALVIRSLPEYKIDGKRDKFLLLCTDGVWNVISSQEAVEIANTAKQKEVCIFCWESHECTIYPYLA